MKRIIALLAISTSALSDELPTSFVHHYTPDVDLVLLADVCNKADLSQGWQAQAKHVDGRTAIGCWIYSKSGDTVLMYLEIEAGKYLDYEIYKDKFEARY